MQIYILPINGSAITDHARTPRAHGSAITDHARTPTAHGSAFKVRKARSKLEKRVQSQKSAPRAEKRTRSQARCLGQRHRVPANRLGWPAEPTSGSSAVPSRPVRPEPKNVPGNRNGVQSPARPNKKEQSPILYTVRSIVLSAIFAARCLLCVTAMTAMLRFSASDRTRSQICACVITSSIVLISSQIR